MSTIGSRIRDLRKRRGMSQEQLAKAVGITQGSLSLIENGSSKAPSASTLTEMCRVLQTTPDFLIAGAGDPDSIDAAIQEHELVFLWREMPEEGRRLILENAHAVKRAFKREKT